MSERNLFMIINNEFKYLAHTTMDHREWYTSLGYDPTYFDSVVRGYVVDHKIVFFKGMTFNYDEEVIKIARMYTPVIREVFQDSSLPAYCGIIVDSYGSKWEPVVHIVENEITGLPAAAPPVVEKPKVQVESGPALELKNDYQDPAFCKKAALITSIFLGLSFLIKIYLFSQNQILQLQNFTDVLLSLAQIGILIYTIYGYHKRLSSAKYSGIVASVLLVLTLDFLDVLLGILYFLFSVDQNYFVTMINFVKGVFEKKKS